MTSFSDQVGEWARATEQRLSAVHKRSLEKLATEMTRTKAEGGNVSVDTGNLYRSLVASTNGLPSTSNERSTGSNATAVIATLRLDQDVWLAYQAAYARRRNYGFVGVDSLGRAHNESGDHFVERAIAMWAQLVRESVQEVQGGGVT